MLGRFLGGRRPIPATVAEQEASGTDAPRFRTASRPAGRVHVRKPDNGLVTRARGTRPELPCHSSGSGTTLRGLEGRASSRYTRRLWVESFKTFEGWYPLSLPGVKLAKNVSCVAMATEVSVSFTNVSCVGGCGFATLWSPRAGRECNRDRHWRWVTQVLFRLALAR